MDGITAKMRHWDLHASTFAQLSPTWWSSTATTKSNSARTGRGLQEMFRQGGCGLSRQNGRIDRWKTCYTKSCCLAFLTAPFSWSGGENLIPLPGVLLWTPSSRHGKAARKYWRCFRALTVSSPSWRLHTSKLNQQTQHVTSMKPAWNIME